MEYVEKSDGAAARLPRGPVSSRPVGRRRGWLSSIPIGITTSRRRLRRYAHVNGTRQYEIDDWGPRKANTRSERYRDLPRRAKSVNIVHIYYYYYYYCDAFCKSLEIIWKMRGPWTTSLILDRIHLQYRFAQNIEFFEILIFCFIIQIYYSNWHRKWSLR